MEKSQPVAPLTIIAIFAGIIESSALATLPFLSETSQSLYTWFLVGFPFFLTALFFLTLNFNYKSLYTPEGDNFSAKETATARPIPDRLTPSAGHQANTLIEPLTLMLSGPDAQKMIEQHLLRTLSQSEITSGTWIYCNLDKQQCFRLSLSELSKGVNALMK